MTHRCGTIPTHHHCSRQTAASLSVRTDTRNSDHHLWNNNGTWYVHYTVAEPGCTGTRCRESLETRDVRQARQRRDELFTRLQGGVL